MPYSRSAIITFLDNDGGLSPDQSLPPFQGRPDNSLPYPGGRPDNSLPRPPGSIGTLPVFPFDPSAPGNELPGPQPTPTPPIQLHPGLRLVVKYLPCFGFIAVPDNSLPETAEPK